MALPRPAKGTRSVNTGLDVLEAQGFAPLRGKRVGLITNQTGVDRRGRSVIDLLANAAGVKLVALFNPEHGLYGRADEKVESSSLDVKTKKGS
ncbi:MAG TPA: exo-beta-N-acetylmuramidase NamZ domain-containing protein, partial [Candidatus Acidoferrales bacterium]